MNTQIPTGSTSKWPSAMMFASLVSDGTIASLDDPVSKYLDYWTTAKHDNRSKVTVRMLLTFTSGFGDGHPGEEANTRAARAWRQSHGVPRGGLGSGLGANNQTHECNMTTGEISKCARSIYEQVALIGEPGKVRSTVHVRSTHACSRHGPPPSFAACGQQRAPPVAHALASTGGVQSLVVAAAAVATVAWR